MAKTGEDLSGLHSGKFENGRPVFQVYLTLYESVICDARKSYLAVIWPTKDYYSANLKFRAENYQNA